MWALRSGARRVSSHALQRADCVVAVDLQDPWVTEVSAPFPDLASNVAELFRLARAERMPIVHARSDYRNARHAPFFMMLNPEKSLATSAMPPPWAREMPGEAVVIKRCLDGFLNTGLEAELRCLGVRRIHVCGLVTSACVLNTCLSALNRGFEVEINARCTADRSRARHEEVLNLYADYLFRVST